MTLIIFRTKKSYIERNEIEYNLKEEVDFIN